MDVQNYQPRGHAFCEISLCQHNINGRCDHLMHADFDDATVDNADTCKDYIRKPLKHFCVDLDEDQMNALLAKLQSAMSDPCEEIYNKLVSIKDDNLVAANMWFINVYYRQQCYGGPEEGGWWYHTVCCEESHGYDSVDYNMPDHVSLQYIIDKFFEMVAAVFDNDFANDAAQQVTAESIKQNLLESDYYEYGRLDSHGEGYFIAIERQPGAQHDTQKQYYC